jgi:hypothetical protein
VSVARTAGGGARADGTASSTPRRHQRELLCCVAATSRATSLCERLTTRSGRRALHERDSTSGRCPRPRPLMNGGLALDPTRSVYETVVVVPLRTNAHGPPLCATAPLRGVDRVARSLTCPHEHRALAGSSASPGWFSRRSARHLCRSQSPCGLRNEPRPGGGFISPGRPSARLSAAKGSAPAGVVFLFPPQRRHHANSRVLLAARLWRAYPQFPSRIRLPAGPSRQNLPCGVWRAGPRRRALLLLGSEASVGVRFGIRACLCCCRGALLRWRWLSTSAENWFCGPTWLRGWKYASKARRRSPVGEGERTTLPSSIATIISTTIRSQAQ